MPVCSLLPGGQRANCALLSLAALDWALTVQAAASNGLHSQRVTLQSAVPMQQKHIGKIRAILLGIVFKVDYSLAADAAPLLMRFLSETMNRFNQWHILAVR